MTTAITVENLGKRYRLGFAVAANLDPEILIVDEVLLVGDFGCHHKCVGKMQDVTKVS